MTKLTKAEREELPARIEAAIATVCSGMAAMSIPANPRDVDLVLADCAKALADLDAAEAELAAAKKLPAELASAVAAYRGAVVDMVEARHVGDGTEQADRLGTVEAGLMMRLAAIEAERDALKQAQVGIMHFVDKWLDELDEADEPTEDPVVRSQRAREIALKWGEGIAAERDAASTAISHAFFGSAVIGATLAERVDYLIGFSKEVEASRCGMVDELASTRKERDALKAKLAALVDFNVAELGRTRKEVWPDCELCRDSTHDHECAGPEPNPRWGELSAAIAAARGGAT